MSAVELATDNFPHPVAFSISGLPDSVTANFAPAMLTGSGATTLTLSANSTAATGNYTLTITGTDTIYADLTQSATVTLILQASQSRSGPPNPSNSVAPGWTARDIGNTGIPGITQLSNGVFSSLGSGLDPAGQTLELESFQFAFTGFFGDGTVVARLDALALGGVAGISIRETLDIGARYALLSTKGFFFRAATGDVGSLVAMANNSQFPQWLKLVRQGNLFSAYTSLDGTTWSQAGASVTINMGPNVYAGLATSSQSTSTLVAASFDNVSVVSSPTSGFALYNASTPIATAGASAVSGTVSQITAPGFGDTVQLSASGTPSGVSATFAPSSVLGNGDSVITFALPSGIASGTYPVNVTGVGTTQTASTPVPLTVLSPLPEGWSSADIGAPATSGQSGLLNQTFILQGNGSGPNDQVDQMQYAYTQLTGDGAITVRLTSLEKESVWAEAGVMFRETLDPGARFMSLSQSGSVVGGMNDWNMVYRTDPGGYLGYLSSGSQNLQLPGWFRLERHANTFTGYTSSDSTNWTQVYSTTMPLSSTVFAGIFAAMDDGSKLATATFDNVSVSNDLGGASQSPTASLSPTSVILTTNQTQQFTATVSNTSNMAVTWTISPNIGTISATGLYTAPAVISAQETVAVVATSAADPSKSASANITLIPPVSAWDASVVPAEPDAGDGSSGEYGVKFRADYDGYVTGIRFYKSPANTGIHIGNLWSSTGTLLASADFTNESSSGWQQVTFSTPGAISANTTYIASYFTSAGHYAGQTEYFASSGVDKSQFTYSRTASTAQTVCTAMDNRAHFQVQHSVQQIIG